MYPIKLLNKARPHWWQIFAVLYRREQIVASTLQ